MLYIWSIVVLPSAHLLWDVKIDQSTISECGVAQRSCVGQCSICDWIRDSNGFGLDHIGHLHGQRCKGADCKVFFFFCVEQWIRKVLILVADFLKYESVISDGGPHKKENWPQDS